MARFEYNLVCVFRRQRMQKFQYVSKRDTEAQTTLPGMRSRLLVGRLGRLMGGTMMRPRAESK
jgi:hypothetical protein